MNCDIKCPICLHEFEYDEEYCDYEGESATEIDCPECETEFEVDVETFFEVWVDQGRDVFTKEYLAARGQQVPNCNIACAYIYRFVDGDLGKVQQWLKLERHEEMYKTAMDVYEAAKDVKVGE